jgi:very-short-patch-repair endonuclease
MRVHWSTITRRQGGLIARRQLSAIGLSPATIDSMLRARRLEPTSATSVYRAVGSPTTHETSAWLAVLSSNSPLSFLSAAQWWGVEDVPADRLVHITRFDRRRLDWPAGVRVHRVRLDVDAVTVRAGLAVTTRTETLLDCLGWLSPGPSRTLADRAVQQGWLSAQDVTRRLQDQPGRWGNRQLRRLLPQFGDGAAAESERRLHRLLRQAGISGWIANMPFVAGGQRFVLDVAFPEARLAIEIDGFRYHSRRDRFQADRAKQNALIKAGWRILRFTWEDLNDRPGYVLAQVLSLLAA